MGSHPSCHDRRSCEEVWPWVAQMGYGRAGWYGSEPAGARGHRRFRPSHGPCPARGRGRYVLLDGPGCDETRGAWKVVALQQPTALVLYSLRGSGDWTRAPPQQHHASVHRLRVELRAPSHRCGHPADGSNADQVGTVVDGLPNVVLPVNVLGGGDTVMQRRLLEGIKARAESAARVRPEDPASVTPTAMNQSRFKLATRRCDSAGHSVTRLLAAGGCRPAQPSTGATPTT